MKRIFAILFLCLYTTQSHAIFWAFSAIKEATMTEEEKLEEKLLEEAEKKSRDYFIGFSAGAGIGDLVEVPLVNPRTIKKQRQILLGNSLEYNIAIEGGWQKYTYEKVGYQVMFRGRFVYMSDFSSPIFSAPIPNKYNSGLTFELSAGIDGIFDFVKTEDYSFGMILGINGGAGIFTPFQKTESVLDILAHNSYGLFSNIRTGFKVGVPTGFVDLVLEVPFLPFMFIKNPYNYTLSLGYKHFF